MSQSQATTLTHHAMLVAWGQFAQCIDLITKVEAVPLHQKAVNHSPNRKVLEFLVAILGGFAYLKDISLSAHPLDQDQAVAQAWGQADWADHSGVSRALSALTMDEVQQITAVLAEVSQAFIDQEVMLALRDQGKIVYDGDLTGRPVSNSSTTYPNVAYGHMSDVVQLGYQAAMVSVHSPTYGRQWLSVTPHPGSTVACTQVEAMVCAAEAKTGIRPRRRTDLLTQRLAQAKTEGQRWAAKLTQAQQALVQAQARLRETLQQLQDWQAKVAQYEAAYQERQRAERPHSRLAQARAKVGVYHQRQARREKAVTKAQAYLERQNVHVNHCLSQVQELERRLLQFEQENVTNPAPVRADFRLDAGFGTPENVALLIEMGYEVYIKPYGTWLKACLEQQVNTETSWQQVGHNAEMTAWAAMTAQDFPYPLDVALERFYTGDSQRRSVLLHYGQDSVTTDLPGWFHTYNGRQTIEAGIKEGKQVFQMHHLKVRSKAALFLQEHLAAFAANFVRWAAHWLTTQCPQEPEGWSDETLPGVKTQVQVMAHTSAYVEWYEQGCLLRFTDHSVFAGRSLRAFRHWAYQLVLPLFRSCAFSPIAALGPPFAQNLR
jgi:hypothetical protein